ncbi:MAG TPA: hypothetical protein DCQ98_04865 [Planctomycetaceae bacterium]|nr:hypothetical protein [Planctomycetaceae bacterium]HRF00030.1 PAS domain-containing sensor histidine kinase [Pirellulaceae bacterium]
MSESRQQLLDQLLDLERRAESIRARLGGDSDDSSSDHRRSFDPHSLAVVQRYVLDTLSEAILIADAQGRVIDANYTARQTFDFSRSRYGTLTVDETLGEILSTVGDDWVDQVRRRKTIHFEGIVEVGSARFEAEVLVVAVEELMLPSIIVAIRNVSAQKRAERENDRLIARLKAKHEELEAFTYRVSHDLKTPLLSIAGFSKLLRKDLVKLIGQLADGRETIDPGFAGSLLESRSVNRGNESDDGDDSSVRFVVRPDRQRSDLEQILADQADYIHELQTAAAKAQMLVDQLLDLARVGQATLRMERISVRDLVRLSLNAHFPEIQAAGIIVRQDDDLGHAWGDFEQLGSVFDNLIANAIRYLERVPNPKLQIEYRRERRRDVWSIVDNGPGIPPEHRDKVFEPFVRFDRKRKGSGIGLALVRRIVELHGGEVWIDEPSGGVGTKVCLTLARQP